MADPMRCDFCSDVTLPPVRLYRAHPYQYSVEVDGRMIIASVAPDWWACAPCAALINAQKQDALTERSLWSNPAYPELVQRGDDDRVSLLYNLISGFHSAFFQHRVPDLRIV